MLGRNTTNINRQITCEDITYVAVDGDGKAEMESEIRAAQEQELQNKI